MQLSWTVTKRSLIHSLSGRMILRIGLVEFQAEEHVASLCLSTWLPSYAHTAHVLPSEWRSSTHKPQDSKINIYPLDACVCVSVKERDKSQEVSVSIIGDFFVVLTWWRHCTWLAVNLCCCLLYFCFSRCRRRHGRSGGVRPYLASSSTLHLLEFESFDLLLLLLLNYGRLHPFTSGFIYFCVHYFVMLVLSRFFHLRGTCRIYRLCWYMVERLFLQSIQPAS